MKIKEIVALGSLAILGTIMIVVVLRGGAINIPMPFTHEEILVRVPPPVIPPTTVAATPELISPESNPTAKVPTSPTTAGAGEDGVGNRVKQPIEQVTYVVRGIPGEWETSESYAEVIVPELRPNTTVTISLRVGWLFPSSNTYEIAFQANVGSANRLRVLLPRYIRPVGTAEFVDLSAITYVFAYATDDPRFSRCGRRVVRMEVGRKAFVFNPPEKAFCRPDDTTAAADIFAALPRP